MKVYVASSWRNLLQQGVVGALKAAGHEVYDFKNPGPGKEGFSWKQINPNWSIDRPAVIPFEHRRMLEHPVAQAGFKSDMDALRECDVCVLVLPCGRSAHLELGWAVGAGKKTVVLEPDPIEPDLMYLMCDRLCISFDELLDYFNVH